MLHKALVFVFGFTSFFHVCVRVLQPLAGPSCALWSRLSPSTLLAVFILPTIRLYPWTPLVLRYPCEQPLSAAIQTRADIFPDVGSRV